MNRESEIIDHQRFIERLLAEFPDALARVDELYGRGLLHIEVGLFRQVTEAAIDAGHAWLAERHFHFVEQVFARANSEVANALEVSYLEDLALGEWTLRRHEIIKERMPAAMRKIMIHHNPQWQ